MQRRYSGSSSNSSAFIDALSMVEHTGSMSHDDLTTTRYSSEDFVLFHNTVMGENEGEIPIRLQKISLHSSKTSVDYPPPSLSHILMIPKPSPTVDEVQVDALRLEKLACVLFPSLYLKRNTEKFRKDWLDLVDFCETSIRLSFNKGVDMNINDFVDEVRRMMRYGFMDIHRTLVSFIHNRRFDTDLKTYHEEEHHETVRPLGSPVESSYPALRWMKEMFSRLLDIYSYAPIESSEELTFAMILRVQVQAFTGMVQYGTQLRANSQTIQRLSLNPFSPHVFLRKTLSKEVTMSDPEMQTSQLVEKEPNLQFIDKFGLLTLKDHPRLEFNFSPDISLGRHLNLSSRKHRSRTTLELYTGTSPLWRLYLVHSSPLHAYDEYIPQFRQIAYSYLWSLQILFPTKESQKWAVSQGVRKAYIEASRLHPPELTSCYLFLNRLHRLESIGHSPWARLRLELKRASLESPLHYWGFWLSVLFTILCVLCLIFLVLLFSVAVARF